MTRTKGNYNYYIFILIFYLIIFRELLENYLPIFGYLDELISCMADVYKRQRFSTSVWSTKAVAWATGSMLIRPIWIFTVGASC